MRTLIPLPSIPRRFVILLPFARAVMCVTLVVFVAFLPFLVMPLFLVPVLVLLMNSVSIYTMLVLLQVKRLVVNRVSVVVIRVQGTMMVVIGVFPIKQAAPVNMESRKG